MRRLHFAVIIIIFSSFLSLANTYSGSSDEMTITCLDGSPVPIMSSMSGTFNVAFNSSNAASFPNILLVMTSPSYSGLTGDVLVSWEGHVTSFSKVMFEAVTGPYIPSQIVTSFDTGRYNASDLYAVLEENQTAEQPLYYCLGPFLSQVIGKEPQTFRVILPSTHPKMLVLILARTFESTFFNIRAYLDPPPDAVPEYPIELCLPLFAAMTLVALVFKRQAGRQSKRQL